MGLIKRECHWSLYLLSKDRQKAANTLSGLSSFRNVMTMYNVINNKNSLNKRQ